MGEVIGCIASAQQHYRLYREPHTLSSCAAYISGSSREQFYWAVVYLTTNKMAIVALGNMALALVVAFGRGLKTVSNEQAVPVCTLSMHRRVVEALRLYQLLQLSPTA